MWRCLLCVCVVCCNSHAHAGEVIAAKVMYDEDHYLLHLDMRIHGKRKAVYRVLMDFAHLPQVNDSITSSQELEHHGKAHRVRTVGEACVWIFCRTITQVETVTELGDDYIMTVTDPKHSDLKYGRSLWQLIDEGKTTRIKYNADIVPAFWVPPLIGPAMVKHRLLEEGQKTVNGIERRITPAKP